MWSCFKRKKQISVTADESRKQFDHEFDMFNKARTIYSRQLKFSEELYDNIPQHKASDPQYFEDLVNDYLDLVSAKNVYLRLDHFKVGKNHLNNVLKYNANNNDYAPYMGGFYYKYGKLNYELGIKFDSIQHLNSALDSCNEAHNYIPDNSDLEQLTLSTQKELQKRNIKSFTNRLASPSAPPAVHPRVAALRSQRDF